jgi:hypothetical protein
MRIEHVLAEVTPQSFIEEAPEPPAAVVECFVRLVEAGEIETAIRLLSREFVTRIGFEKLESIFSASSSEIWSAGGIESVDVQTVAFSRDHVEMQLSMWFNLFESTAYGKSRWKNSKRQLQTSRYVS